MNGRLQNLLLVERSGGKRAGLGGDGNERRSQLKKGRRTFESAEDC